jgi:hypothetical protein
MAWNGARNPIDRRILAGLIVAALCAATAIGTVGRGHAAGTSVAAGRMTTLRPAQLPPKCSTVTLTASADTFIDQNAPGSNYGSAALLEVLARNNANRRALIQFTLPTAPTGCTLASATLRINNAAATTGRTISAYRAGMAWTEGTVTWTSHTAAPAGTAVNAAAASGSMTWTVTAHVQAMYAGSNHGFLLRDATESGPGNTNYLQQFTSRDGATKPQLDLQWQ